MAYISFQPTDYCSTKLYTGNASTNAITGVGFAPAMAWFKSRSNTNSHAVFNALMGAYSLSPSNTAAQYDSSGDGFTSLDSDGYTMNGSGGGGGTNASGFTYVGWNWKAGTTSGIATNGSTTITPSSYSFDQTSGFSVIQYAGNSTSGAKIAHGLGATPAFIIIKPINLAGQAWVVYHQGLGETKYMEMNTTSAAATASWPFNDTAPDSVNFTVGNNNNVNRGYNYLALCFAEKSGYSKFTSYMGNGNADGPFIHTGFQPSWLMIKETDSTSGWCMYDNKRPLSNPGYYNVNQNFLQANDTGSESDNSNLALDFLSNGFKIRNSAGDTNGAGNSYIVMAFAEFPFVSSNSKSGTAR